MKAHWRSITAALLGLFVLAGSVVGYRVLTNPGWSLKKFQTQPLNWSSCYGNFDCTSFKVPVDYNAIDDRTFTLQVLRHKAIDQRNRLGALIVNPGGPGGSGVDYAYNADSIVSPALISKYDIVGFDPRGVNTSEPIRCLSDKAEDEFLANDGQASNMQEVRAMVAKAKNFAASCARAAGDRIGHYSTLEGAKDMEILRLALGEKKLNYLGKSYGTYLGTLYAALYPNSIGHMVLDGAVDPNVSLKEQNLIQAQGFDQALNDFLASQHKFTLADIEKLIADAKEKPMVTTHQRSATQALIITAIAASLYDNQAGWPKLAIALTQAINYKNPNELLSIADDYYQRDSFGKYVNNENDISNIITCSDWSVKDSPEQMLADRSRFQAAAPIFGPFLNFAGLTCKYWKAAPVAPKRKLTNIKTPPIIVIGVTRDPATPYLWSKALAGDLTNSVLLTFDGEGHTGHGRGNSCIDSKVDAYFLTGQSPAPGLVCVASGN